MNRLSFSAVHEVIADRMSRSRRLIIVLTSQSCVSPQTDATKSLSSDKLPISDRDVLLKAANTSSDQIWAAYEQRVGLYDALVKQGLKVILVQVEDGVEEALLPESLRYISRTKGILKWRQNASNRGNRSFWKHMRYQMPPAKRRKSRELTVLWDLFNPRNSLHELVCIDYMTQVYYKKALFTQNAFLHSNALLFHCFSSDMTVERCVFKFQLLHSAPMASRTSIYFHATSTYSLDTSTYFNSD